jgi:hypothetical protein
MEPCPWTRNFHFLMVKALKREEKLKQRLIYT